MRFSVLGSIIVTILMSIFFLHKTHRMLKSILYNTCELVQLLNAWAIPKSAIPLQILKISKQMLILLKKFIIIFTLMLLVYEIRKSNAVIEGQSNVFFLYLVGQFREKNKRVELIDQIIPRCGENLDTVCLWHW